MLMDFARDIALDDIDRTILAILQKANGSAYVKSGRLATKLELRGKPVSAATLWRRLSRLEGFGYVCRNDDRPKSGWKLDN